VEAVSLIVDTLEGVIDRVAVAIERIQTFVPEEGYYVAFSGGKDSQVVLDLVERSGVKFDAHYHVTTVDPPELVRFIRAEYPQVEWNRPDESMYQLIRRKRLPPTRRVRYCCDYLKENGGGGRVVVTGIRWGESSRRSKRRLTESCFKDKSRTFVNPIIDWADEDVWQYIRERGLRYCELYDQGFDRIGCVMCPLQSQRGMNRDVERWPKFAAMYRRACDAAYAKSMADGHEYGHFTSGEDIYRWFLTRGDGRDCDPQLFPMDN
jgi:phosphoadenosine phosphosulfate reductase